jgi:hypothetical protein
MERTFWQLLVESRRSRSSRPTLYSPLSTTPSPTPSWILTITSYSVSVEMPQTRTSKRHTKKWYLLIPLFAHHPDLTSPNSQALKWHPDRNAGSEEASQKFKQVSSLLMSSLRHANHYRYQRLLRSSVTSKSAQYMTNLAKKVSKMAVLLPPRALDPVHSLGSAACLAVEALEGQPSPLYHLASLAAEVVTHHQTL